MTTYDKGEVVELPTTFTNTATGALVDPATVTLITVAPDGTQTTYTYPADEIVKDAVGTYRGLVETDDDGEWGYRWETLGPKGAKQGNFQVRPSITDGEPTVTTTYLTVQQLRDALGLGEEALSDHEAKRLILDAEDLVDEELGARPVDSASGRKVVRAHVEDWQWTKLARATAKLAAMLHSDPTVAGGQRWKKISGPDFTFEGRAGSAFGAGVVVLLNQTGLRRLTTTMSRGRERFALGYPSNADPVYED